MLFSQTSGQALESRPVFSAESSKDYPCSTVPVLALCAPSQLYVDGNYSQLQMRSRQSYSQAAQATWKAFGWPSRAAYE
jgi:hypothetical protein